MISFASQRGLGQDLATHLMNTHDNEIMDVAEVRGAVAQDLHGAFAEWEFQAHALTRCRKYLYSMSINPDPDQKPLSRDQYHDYIARTEEKLGLEDQPRAIVFHQKYGREHCHVVWSRIDREQEKAVQLSFDKEKLMQVTREFAIEHGIELPDGYQRDGKGKGDEGKGKKSTEQISLYEQSQETSTGISKEKHKEQVTEAWELSDCPKAFVHALAEQGYVLATGKRPFVVVDIYGSMNSLPKLIDDKNIKTNELRKYFAKDFPSEYLPDVDEAKNLLQEHLKAYESCKKSDRLEDEIMQLKTSHKFKRSGLEQDKTDLKQKQHQDRLKLGKTQRVERDKHRTAYLKQKHQIKIDRANKKTNGIAELIGRATGLEAVRKKLHKYQDKKRLNKFKIEKQQIKQAQNAEQKKLELCQISQGRELQRQDRVLQRVEAREVKSLNTELKRDLRVQDKARYFSGRDNIAMRVLEIVLENKTQHKKNDLQQQIETQFKSATTGKKQYKKISLKQEFDKATSDEDQSGKGDEEATTTKAPKLDLEALPIPKPKRTRRRRSKQPRKSKDQDLGRKR